MNDKAASLLGMARRAGKLEAGFERCATAVKSGKAKLVIVCADISDKTKKEMNFLCTKHNVPLTQIPFTLSQLSAAIGFKAGICAVCEQGFANRLTEYFGG
ncbi:MAG: ribosomal L7Ae/L30e/S12e/Gadd45 family protein [Clostridia bacterium]|nr:ribosomal L7Ae/L30e/S12e/Gadd45 family protein [Clostridia bacterium]